jgi:hypothetical protein
MFSSRRLAPLGIEVWRHDSIEPPAAVSAFNYRWDTLHLPQASAIDLDDFAPLGWRPRVGERTLLIQDRPLSSTLLRNAEYSRLGRGHYHWHRDRNRSISLNNQLGCTRVDPERNDRIDLRLADEK